MGKKYNGYIAYNESTKTKCIYVGKHPLEKGKNIWLVAFENYMYDKTNTDAYKTKEVSTCRIFKDKELLFDEEAIISIKNRISQLESEIINLKTRC